LSLSVATLKKAVTSKTAGVVIVHIGGIISKDIGEIKSWCDKKGLWLFEDCAHAHGSEIYERKAGNFGIAGGYSFFATKVMTSGEGGMVVTNDKDFADKVKLLRNHGKEQPWVSYHTAVGSNWRMNEFSACVGVNQLSNLDKFIEWREKIVNVYNEILLQEKDLKIVLPQGTKNSWYKYIVVLPKYIAREAIKSNLLKKEIKLQGGVYEVPLHQQPIMKAYKKGKFPVADEFCSRHICLPLYYGMFIDEAKYVANSLIESIKQR
jgi:dTDP-4-amino-4,6-dideoxygalactose transaminase